MSVVNKVDNTDREQACACPGISTNIFYNAQLSRMSHCAPVAGKPICLEFTPEAAVGDILVA